MQQQVNTASVAKSGAWLTLDNAAAAVIAFVFFVAMARTLSIPAFGTAALILSIVQILGPMIESLFHDALIQRHDLDRGHVTTATITSIAWGALLAALLWLLAPLIGSFFGAPEMGGYLRWIGLALVFTGVNAVPAACARRDLAFRPLALRTIVARVTGAAVGLALLLQGYGIWAVVAQFLVTAAVSAGLVAAIIGLDLGGGFSLRRLRELLHFAVPAMGTQLLLFANGRVVALIIGALLGASAAGIWQIAFRFVEPLQLFLATTIGQLSLPIMARRQGEQAALGTLFLTATRHAATLAIPAFAGIAVCAPQVITLFVGERWLAAAPLMRIVALVTLIAMARQLCEIVLSAVGRPSRNFATHAIASILSIAGVLASAPFGLLAATIGWSLRALAFLFLYGRFVRQAVNLSLGAQLRPVVPALIAAAGMAGIVLVVQHATADRSALVLLLLSVTIGIGSYVAILGAISRPFRADLKALLRRNASAAAA